jgi:hypothetical protein
MCLSLGRYSPFSGNKSSIKPLPVAYLADIALVAELGAFFD